MYSKDKRHCGIWLAEFVPSHYLLLLWFIQFLMMKILRIVTNDLAEGNVTCAEVHWKIFLVRVWFSHVNISWNVILSNLKNLFLLYCANHLESKSKLSTFDLNWKLKVWPKVFFYIRCMAKHHFLTIFIKRVAQMHLGMQKDFCFSIKQKLVNIFPAFSKISKLQEILFMGRNKSMIILRKNVFSKFWFCVNVYSVHLWLNFDLVSLLKQLKVLVYMDSVSIQLKKKWFIAESLEEIGVMVITRLHRHQTWITQIGWNLKVKEKV